MSERLEIAETGQVMRGDKSIAAFSIWERHAIGEPDTPVVMRAQVAVDEDETRDVTVGDTIEIGDETWRVDEITEDPVNRRGQVVLVRTD